MKHGKKTFVIIEAVLGILVILVLGFIIYKQNGHEPATIAVIIPDVDEFDVYLQGVPLFMIHF